MKPFSYILFFSLFFGYTLHAQKDSIATKKKEKKIKFNNGVYNPLSPAKAAFLSAVIPGAGQIYNNRYWWQLPLIYGGLGYSAYSYFEQNDNYNRYRTAYRRRQAGLTDEFTVDGVEIITDSGLESAQEQANKNRNYSILSFVLTYVLQITEASVRAHLLQFNTSKDLSIRPSLSTDYTYSEKPKVGLTIKYSF